MIDVFYETPFSFKKPVTNKGNLEEKFLGLTKPEIKLVFSPKLVKINEEGANNFTWRHESLCILVLDSYVKLTQNQKQNIFLKLVITNLDKQAF